MPPLHMVILAQDCPTLDEGMIREVADRIKQARTADEVREIMAELTTKSSKVGNGRLAVGKINYTVWSDVFICPDCTRGHLLGRSG